MQSIKFMNPAFRLVRNLESYPFKSTYFKSCFLHKGIINFSINNSLQTCPYSLFSRKTSFCSSYLLRHQHSQHKQQDIIEKLNSTTKNVVETKQQQREDVTPVDESEKDTESPPEKLTLYKRYKKMLKQYWYILLPVHMVTSAVWFGGFYYAASIGLDIKPFLEYINLPEVLIAPLRNPFLGNIAVASAFYKLAFPARYMVTLGVSSMSVKFLTKRGLIKPVPTKAEIKTILQKKLKKDEM